MADTLAYRSRERASSSMTSCWMRVESMSKTARRDGWDGELAGDLCRVPRGLRTRERESASV